MISNTKELQDTFRKEFTKLGLYVGSCLPSMTPVKNYKNMPYIIAFLEHGFSVCVEFIFAH
jgi:hypothetical protein